MPVFDGFVEGYWMRNKDWFFNWNETDQLTGLYNMKEDPFNDHDLSEKHPELVQEYRKKIEAWKKEKGR